MRIRREEQAAAAPDRCSVAGVPLMKSMAHSSRAVIVRLSVRT
jgi:hypothetical protein